MSEVATPPSESVGEDVAQLVSDCHRVVLCTLSPTYASESGELLFILPAHLLSSGVGDCLMNTSTYGHSFQPHPPQPIRVGTFGTSLIPRTRLRTRCCGPQGARHCRVVIVRRVGQIDLWRFELDCRRTLFGAAIGTDSDLRVQVVDALLIYLLTQQNAVRVWTRGDLNPGPLPPRVDGPITARGGHPRRSWRRHAMRYSVCPHPTVWAFARWFEVRQ